MTQSISIRKEKELLTSMLFTKTRFSKVKYMPFDYNWVILKEYEPVASALVKISGAVLMLSMCQFMDKHSNFVIDHVRFIFNTLKDGLILIGCKNPPRYHVSQNVNIHKDTLLEIARQVNENFIIESE